MFISQIKQEQQQQQNDENNTDNINVPQQTDHQKFLAETLQGDINSKKIFSYKDKAPAAPDFHQNPLRVVYSVKTPLSTKSGTRYIPHSPERILDAPDIINDYCKIYFLNFWFKKQLQQRIINNTLQI